MAAAGEADSCTVGLRAARPRLATITYFRATAILLVVAGHSYGPAGIHLSTGFDDTLSNLIEGATALFVFISGFLFDYVYCARYNYRSLLLDRAQKLLIPYCVLTLLAALMLSSWAGGGLSAKQLFRDFVLGETFQAYWYIPFILVMFALAPLHRIFMGLKISHQAAIIITAAILAALVQRPIHNDNTFQSVLFYLPVYLSGIFLSLHRETLLPVLQKYWSLLLLAAILLAVIQSLSGQSDNMQKPFFALQGFELMVFQKLVLSLAMVGLFAMFVSPPPPFRPHRWTPASRSSFSTPSCWS